MMSDEKATIQAAIDQVEVEYDADIFAYAAPIFPNLDDKLISLCRDRGRRSNLLMVIETPGGTADAAYRMARAIQRCYCVNEGKFILYVPRYCKSAGTIFALGSDRIIMSQEAELGPIDVQLRKDDEVGERTSGLTPHQALDTLAGEAMLHFRRFFKHLRYDDDTMFSTKLSAELATSMAVGLMSPIYQQMDPLRLGEVERFIRIAVDYGDRLRSENVKPQAIEALAADYPSHGFVIDREEAEDKLFHKVEKPTDALEKVGKLVVRAAQEQEVLVRFLNRTIENSEGQSNASQRNTKRPRSKKARTAGNKVRQNSKKPDGATDREARVG